MTEIAALRASLNAMRALVGAVFAYTVFDNFSHHNYSAGGYRHLISGYLRHDNSQFFHPFMQFASDHSTVFGPLQAVAEISIAVALLVGVAVPFAALLASGLLTGLFLAETGLYWTLGTSPTDLDLRCHGPGRDPDRTRARVPQRSPRTTERRVPTTRRPSRPGHRQRLNPHLDLARERGKKRHHIPLRRRRRPATRNWRSARRTIRNAPNSSLSSERSHPANASTQS